MPYAQNQGIKVYYESYGQGKPLVLVIGLGGTTDAWKYQIDFFSKYYQVIVFDNRGAGKTDKPDEPYNMKLFASDLKAILDDLKLDKVSLLGLSMGGLIIQEFYHANPNHVEKLILGCTGVGAGDPKYTYPGITVMNTLSMKKSEYDIHDYYSKWIKIFYHPDFLEKMPDLADRMVEASKKNTQPEYAHIRQLEACVLKEGEYNSPRLKNIKVPTLVIHGEDDQIWPLENAKYLAENIPNAKLVIMKNCAHMFFIEKMAEFNQNVLNFLQDQS